MESCNKAAVKIMLAITLAVVCPATIMVNAQSGKFFMYSKNEFEITGKSV